MEKIYDKTDKTRSFRRSTSHSTTRRLNGPRIIRGLLTAVALLALWSFTPSRYSRINYLPCQHLPGASDTVVIMKTGVTEIEDRLPSQVEYTLRCPQHKVIFSDHEEMFLDRHPVRDVLAKISPDILASNSDFTLYHRVKEVGRMGLLPQDLTGVRTTDNTTEEEKKALPGWVLDKWKFIPMMTETFRLYPNMKWYVFIESDTYLFWSTVLKYTSTMDHRQPHCFGHRTTRLADHQFMQGGSGYVLSHEALRRVTQYIQANSRDLDIWMQDEWAGDISLGKVLSDANIPLTYAWPIFQPAFFGVTYFGVDFEENRRYWCYPAGTYHHMTPDTIADMWHMEQQWIKEENDDRNPYKFLSQGHVFNSLIMPAIRFPLEHWDNYANIPISEAQTLEDCRQTCVDDLECKQYQFDRESLQCKIAFVPLYGEAKLDSDMYSEWLFDRVEKWRDGQLPCVRESFLHYGDIDLDL